MNEKSYFILYLLLVHAGCSAVFQSFQFKHLPGCHMNYAMPNVIASLQSRSKQDCSRLCGQQMDCLGFSLCPDENSTSSFPFLCQLVSQWSQDSCGLLSPAPGCSFWQMDLSCIHGNVNTQTRRCTCTPGYAGTACERLIRDCQEGKDLGLTGQNDNTLIQPIGALAPFTTRCNYDSGVTTLIKRGNWCSNTDVFKTKGWQDLKTKTGTCDSCCFVGLENMYHLLNQGLQYTLTVYMQYNGWASAARIDYPAVQMKGEGDRYSLLFGTPTTVPYVSPADDGFPSGGNRKFLSPDNDVSGCAYGAGHAGWFDNSGCEKTEGLGDPLQWPIGGSMTNLNLIVIELERN